MDTTKKNGKVKINNKWFLAAGNVYGWVKDGYHVFGVGISNDYFCQFDELQVEIDGGLYTLDVNEAVLFIQKYDSIKKIKGRTIGVVSKSLLQEK